MFSKRKPTSAADMLGGPLASKNWSIFSGAHPSVDAHLPHTDGMAKGSGLVLGNGRRVRERFVKVPKASAVTASYCLG